MDIIPIQVTDEGVIIPRIYLHNAGEVEVVVTPDYILLKPKATPADATKPDTPSRFDFIGIGESANPNLAEEAEEILTREIKQDSGWSLS
jgi:hypothetical protein